MTASATQLPEPTCHYLCSSPDAFQRAGGAASGNRTLRDAVENARASMFGLLDPHGFEIIHETSHRGHDSILWAIRRANPKAAERHLRQHVVQASAEVEDALSPAD